MFRETQKRQQSDAKQESKSEVPALKKLNMLLN